MAVCITRHIIGGYFAVQGNIQPFGGGSYCVFALLGNKFQIRKLTSGNCVHETQPIVFVIKSNACGKMCLFDFYVTTKC